jgi:hypothetical protein
VFWIYPCRRRNKLLRCHVLRARGKQTEHLEKWSSLENHINGTRVSYLRSGLSRTLPALCLQNHSSSLLEIVHWCGEQFVFFPSGPLWNW